MKICKKCQRELELSTFPNRKGNIDGLHIYCKKCYKKSKNHYYQTNRENILKRMKEKKIPGSRSEYLKEYYIKNKEKSKRATQEYRKKNRDKINTWCREYYKDPAKRIARNMYNRVRVAIFAQLTKKAHKTALLCGCTWEELVRHLSDRFKPNMSWSNYGFGDGRWSIDHIKPCILFDLTKPEEQKKCFHYTNLQPLWSNENSAKKDKYEIPSL